MRDAVVADFELAGFEIVESVDSQTALLIIAPDDKLPSELELYLKSPPEIEHLSCGQTVAGQQKPCSLNSDSTAIFTTADKLLTYEIWRNNGVATPRTQDARKWSAESLPCVIKPRYGCGSENIRLIPSPEVWNQINRDSMSDLIAQEYVPGFPASLSLLIGPGTILPLVASLQDLSRDGRFEYLGGRLPLTESLQRRAVALAKKAVGCIPGLIGYVGVDLVLGQAADGTEDYAIEINPRLTTSYVGLRSLADFNIAQMMMNIIQGRGVDYVRWKPGHVRFWSDGRVDYNPGGDPFSGNS